MSHPFIDYLFSDIYGACLIIDDIAYLPLTELVDFVGTFVLFLAFEFFLAYLFACSLDHLLVYLWSLIKNYISARKADEF